MTREELNKELQKEIQNEVNSEKKKKILKLFIKLIIFLILAFILFFTYTTYISTVKIGVREYRVINPKIPDSFNGTKIIQFSDLHFGTTMFDEEVKKITKLSNERNPDIVVFTGDLISKNYSLSSKEKEKLIKLLKSINANLGKYAILGDEDTESISTIFNQSEFTVLRNTYELIYKNENNSILLIGIDSKNSDIDKAYDYFKQDNHNANIYTITLTHKPDLVDNIKSSNHSDIYMAGHSHNGNIRIPFVKYSIFKIDGAKKYDQDYYKLGDSELYVSSGLGTKNGIRLFCRPTINFFRLSNK